MDTLSDKSGPTLHPPDRLVNASRRFIDTHPANATISVSHKEETMKRFIPAVLLATFMFAGCVVTPGRGGYGVEVAPALPAVIELDASPYYVHGGFYYFYHDNRWDYARTRNGPWRELPRSHWPREIRHRGEHRDRDYRYERGRGHERGHDHDHGHDDD
jgi:hypothetical protein